MDDNDRLVNAACAVAILKEAHLCIQKALIFAQNGMMEESSTFRMLSERLSNIAEQYRQVSVKDYSSD